jgi:hypothetical protein
MGQKASILVWWLIALFVTNGVGGPKARAASVEDKRRSLVFTHVAALGNPDPWWTPFPSQWNYTQGYKYAQRSYLAYIYLSFKGMGAPAVVNGQTQNNCWLTVRANHMDQWSMQEIINFVRDQEPGWGGQCLSYVGTLLMMSGATDGKGVVLHYADLEKAAQIRPKAWSEAQWGDVAFRRGSDHVMVLLGFIPGVAAFVGDSNWGLTDPNAWPSRTSGDPEHIQTRYIPADITQSYQVNGRWQQPFRIVDLGTLLQVLEPRYNQ